MYVFSYTNQSSEDKSNGEMEKISLITSTKAYIRANFKRNIPDLHEGNLTNYIDRYLRKFENMKDTLF